MSFKNLAYAKLNLDFDRDFFCKEYDEKILPFGSPTGNSQHGLEVTKNLNKAWGMVPEKEYDEIDTFDQPGDVTTYKFNKKKRSSWIMNQLMYIDSSNITDPLILMYSQSALGPSIRNEGLDPKYIWKIKPQYENLEIVKWINENLPFKKINGIHCVSIEPGGFASIHRDSKGFHNSNSSAGSNRLYKSGYVVININISDGGVPLYWAYDGKDVKNYYLSNDCVYLTNDYFLHGVPIVNSRRRQIRVTGIPKDELWNLIDKDTIMSIQDDYEYDPSGLTSDFLYR